MSRYLARLRPLRLGAQINTAHQARLAVQPFASQFRSFRTTPQPFGPAGTSPTLTRGLPEFSLKDKVIVVSGGARGLGLTQAEALLEAGAIGMIDLSMTVAVSLTYRAHSPRHRPPPNTRPRI